MSAGLLRNVVIENTAIKYQELNPRVGPHGIDYDVFVRELFKGHKRPSLVVQPNAEG